MNADGSGQHRLTHPPVGTEDMTADWSPDGVPDCLRSCPMRGAHSISGFVRADGTGFRLTPCCPPGRGIPKCRADDRSATERAAFGYATRPRRPNAINVALSGKTSGRLRPQNLSPEVAGACRRVISPLETHVCAAHCRSEWHSSPSVLGRRICASRLVLRGSMRLCDPL